jgi:3-hydroxybutyrate dehydrogenase
MLKGRNAVITGSTSGIGLGIARALAAEGCNIVLNGFGDPAEIEKTRAELAASASVTVLHHGADMRRPGDIADLVSVSESKLGSVDILANCAGIQRVMPIDDVPDDLWDDIIAINLSSLFRTTRAVLPGMRRRNWGRIINIASTHGLVASVNKGPYIAAKHGVVGLTKAVALETAETGITCNAICPGWTLTPLLQPQVEAKAKELGVSTEEGGRALIADKTPTKRFVRIEQLAALAVFLCSDAASEMTGTALPMDGAWTAQ